MKRINNLFKNLFKRRLNQNERLIKNMEEYAKKKKTEQQKSEVLEQGEKRWSKNKKENINVYHTS